jgi:hypothetical protein
VSEEGGGKSLYVAKLSYRTTTPELEDAFTKFGKVLIVFRLKEVSPSIELDSFCIRWSAVKSRDCLALIVNQEVSRLLRWSIQRMLLLQSRVLIKLCLVTGLFISDFIECYPQSIICASQGNHCPKVEAEQGIQQNPRCRMYMTIFFAETAIVFDLIYDSGEYMGPKSVSIKYGDRGPPRGYASGGDRHGGEDLFHFLSASNASSHFE